MEDVIFRFEQLCELKYSGSTPKNYASLVSKFLNYCKTETPTKEDVLNYNIHLREKSYSQRNTSLSAIKAFFALYKWSVKPIHRLRGWDVSDTLL